MKAQLHVMRDSFNRLQHPPMADHPQVSALSSAGATGSFPPPDYSNPGANHDMIRNLLAQKQEAGMSQSGGSRYPNVPMHVPLSISSSTRSSLPPSVASWLEQDHQQQRQQLPSRKYTEMSQQAGVPGGMMQPPHLTQNHHLPSNSVSGYDQPPHPHSSRGIFPVFLVLHFLDELCFCVLCHDLGEDCFTFPHWYLGVLCLASEASTSAFFLVSGSYMRLLLSQFVWQHVSLCCRGTATLLACLLHHRGKASCRQTVLRHLPTSRVSAFAVNVW